MKTKSKISEEDLKQTGEGEGLPAGRQGLPAGRQGRKLGFLIAHSLLPEKVKIELVALLPRFSPIQLVRLLEIFEARFSDEATHGIDDEYRRKAEKLVEDFLAEEEKSEGALINKINSLI